MTTVETYQFEYADTPPSMNTNKIRSHWSGFQREKKRWEGIFAMLCLKEHVPKRCSLVKADVVLRFPIKRNRDEGNFRTLVEKALGDALQVAGVIPDDSPAYFEVGRLTFAEEKGKPLTSVHLEVWR